MTKLKIAVAGAGLIGRRHIEVIGRSKACELAAIIDPAPHSESYVRGLGVPRFASLAAYLECERPDGIVLATPNNLHADQALECIAASVPAIIEKPLAHTLECGEKLLHASERANAKMLVGHHRRYSAIIARAVEAVQSGVLGELVAIVGTAMFYKADNEGYFDGPFAWRREPGGGPILINMVHEVGNLRALAGEIVAVQAFSSNERRGFPVEDTVAINLRFENAALGSFMLSDVAATDRSWEHTSGEDKERYSLAHSDEDDCYLVCGTRGSLAIPTMRLQRYPRDEDRSWHKPLEKSRIPIEVIDPLDAQIAHFCDVIEGKAKPLVSIADGLQNLRVVAAIGEAARTNQIVNLAPHPTLLNG